MQVHLMHERGYQLGNVDITIIAQQPKLSPHKEKMRDQLCHLLGSHPSTVNIKVSQPLAYSVANSRLQAYQSVHSWRLVLHFVTNAIVKFRGGSHIVRLWQHCC